MTAWVALVVGGSSLNDNELGVGAAFLVDGIIYALVGCVAGVQFVRNCCRYRPWTAQKMIHFLMFVATLGKLVICSCVALY